MTAAPATWAAASLLQVASLVRGVTYTKADVAGAAFVGSMPVLRANNIQERSFDCNDLVHVPSTLVSKSQRIRKGDVVIATSSGNISVVGKAAQAKVDMNAGFGAFCGLLRPSPHINPSYFGHFFSSNEYRSAVSSMARGVNINNLKRDHFEKLILPLPPFVEQKRIADKLDSLLERVDSCRDRLDRIPLILKRFRQSVLAAATSGKLTEEWSTKRTIAEPHYERVSFRSNIETFAAVGSVTGGLTKNPSRDALMLKRPYLRVANVHANELRLDDVSDIGLTEAEYRKTKLEERDLLIVEGNGSIEQIGRVALWDGRIPDCSHQNHLIRWRAGGRVLPAYALYFLLSPDGRRQIEKVASSTTGLHTLSVSKVGALKLPVPALDEQAEIVRRVEALFALADRLEARYTAARARVDRLTPALLTKAFRGELVPQDPADEPAQTMLDRLKAEASATDSATKTPRGRRRVVTPAT